MCGVGHAWAVVCLVHETVVVVVFIRATIGFNVIFRSGYPADGSLWTGIVIIEDAVFIVVSIFGSISATVAVMVGDAVRGPPHITGRAIVLFIDHGIAVDIVIADITVGVGVQVGLVVICRFGAVVNAVENAVQIQVGFVQPEAHVVLLALVKGVRAKSAIIVGNEGHHR